MAYQGTLQQQRTASRSKRHAAQATCQSLRYALVGPVGSIRQLASVRAKATAHSLIYPYLPHFQLYRTARNTHATRLIATQADIDVIVRSALKSQRCLHVSPRLLHVSCGTRGGGAAVSCEGVVDMSEHDMSERM